MRINKFLALCRLGSRRGAEDIITAGRVKINGVTVTNLATDIADTDTVTVDGKPIAAQTEKVYIMLNKPTGTVTTMNDPQGRKTVTDIIYENPKQYRELLGKVRLFPVGRLDYNTGGLLLLTNDGELANRLIHPGTETEKVYIAVTDRPINENELVLLSSGVVIKEMPRVPRGAVSGYVAQRRTTPPLLRGATSVEFTRHTQGPACGGQGTGCRCKIHGRTQRGVAKDSERKPQKPFTAYKTYKTAPAVFEYNDKKPGTQHIIRITIHEGRNRQIRKMFETIGAEVKQLQRIAEGSLRLGNLKPGEWRFVRRNEVCGKQ